MRYLYFFLLILLTNTAKAQQWNKLLYDRNATFQSVRDAYFKDTATRKYAGEEEDDDEARFKRWETFWSQRIDSMGRFMFWYIQDSITKLLPSNSLINYQLNGSPPVPGSPVVSGWKSLGPNATLGGYAGLGRVNCLGFHPSNPDIMYAGTNGGGIWKTIDGGNNWAPMSDKIGPLSVVNIEVNRSNPDIVYFTASGNARGLWKSVDGGLNWNNINTDGYGYNPKVLINPANTNEILYKTQSYVYRSANGGVSFVSNLISLSDIIRNPQNPNILYGIQCNSSKNPIKLYRSTDGGTVWNQVQAAIPGGNWPKLAVSAAQPNLVEFSVANDSGGLRALYSSRDTGLTYTAYLVAADTTNYFSLDAKPKGYSAQGGWGTIFVLDPGNPAIKFLGCGNTWKTIDDGKTWRIKNFWYTGGAGDTVQAVHADKHSMYYHPLDPTRIYETNDGGIYLTADSGRTWKNKTNTMVNSEIYRITPPAPTLSAGFLITGLQDNGTKLMDQNGTWVDIGGGDGMVSQIDYSDTTVGYFSYQYGDIVKYKLQNGKVIYGVNVSNNIPGGKPSGPWVTSYQINPKNPQSLIGGYKDIYRTYDRGNSWMKLTTNLAGGADIQYLQYAQSDTNTIFVLGGNAIYKTTDGGKSWINISKNIPLTGFYLTCIYVHPKDPLKVWAVNSFNAGKTIYRSNDGGTTWTNITYDLSVFGNFSSIVVADGTANDDVYLIGDIGVFYSNNSMNTWASFDTGLPKCYKGGAAIDYTTNSLLLGSYGRGTWSTPLQNVPAFSGGTCSVSGNSFKGGDSVFIRYVFNRHYFRITNNRFKVQLSDVSGSFNNPTDIGYKDFYLGDHGFNVVMPSTVPCGTNYKIRVIASLPADTTSFSLAIGIINKPAMSITAANTSFCNSDSVKLSVPLLTNYVYKWYKDSVIIPGENSNVLYAKKPGIYYCAVSGGLCDAVSNVLMLVSNASPAMPVVTATRPVSFCQGDSTMLNTSSVSGLTYQWYKDTVGITGANGIAYTTGQSGTYTVKVTNGNNCSSISSGTIVTVNPIPPKPLITRSGADMSSNSTVGNQWYQDAIAITGATASTYRPVQSGYFRVKVTQNGCSSPVSDAYYYLVTAVSNIGNGNNGSYKIVPNPVTERLYINAGTNTDKITVQLIDENGRIVLSDDFSGTTEIDMRSVGKGVYTLLLTNSKNKKQESKQIIKL